MIANPKKRDRVQCWYGPRARGAMPHHGRVGIVVIVGTGTPRNHGVAFFGAKGIVTVPCGNLRREPVLSPCCRCGEGGCTPADCCLGCGYHVCHECDVPGEHLGDGRHERAEAKR